MLGKAATAGRTGRHTRAVGCALPCASQPGPGLWAHLAEGTGSRDAPGHGPLAQHGAKQAAQQCLNRFFPRLFISQLENVALLHYEVGGTFNGRFFVYPGCSPREPGADSRRDSQDCGTARNAAPASAGLQETATLWDHLLGNQTELCRGISVSSGERPAAHRYQLLCTESFSFN